MVLTWDLAVAKGTDIGAYQARTRTAYIGRLFHDLALLIHSHMARWQDSFRRLKHQE